jgi:uncharacterized protein (TIGR03067 family)
MVPRFVLALTLAMVFLNSADTGAPKADDARNIQGDWIIVAVEGPKKPAPDELKKLRLHITADKFTVKADGEDVCVSTYKLTAGKKPAEIDLVVTVLINRGDAILQDKQARQGIYELRGDDLKVCVALATDKKTPNPPTRPTEFKTSGDLNLLILRRAPKN